MNRFGDTVSGRLEEAKRSGATRDELLRTAVTEMARAKETYDWVGIYLLEGDTLVLHNYSGRPTDHERIAVGAGVCGTAVAEGRDINIPDVQAVDNYLACSLETRSEIVVLIRNSAGEIYGQLDLDSDTAGAFGPTDEEQLRCVADWLLCLFEDDAGAAKRAAG